MKIIKESITIEELREMAKKMFGDLVKADIDVEKETMIVDMELHADGEARLIEEGSLQKNLWGINLYPAIDGEDFIEFDSMINIRPGQGNRSRGVENEKIRKKITEIVGKLVKR